MKKISRIGSLLLAASLGLEGCLTKPEMPIRASAEYINWESAKTEKPLLVAQGREDGKVAAYMTNFSLILPNPLSAQIVNYNSKQEMQETMDFAKEPASVMQSRWTSLISPKLEDSIREPGKVARNVRQPKKYRAGNDSVYFICGQSFLDSVDQLKEGPYSKLDRLVIDIHGEKGITDLFWRDDPRFDPSINKDRNWISADELSKVLPRKSLKRPQFADTEIILSICYSDVVLSGNDQSIAQVLADAFDQPVLAATTKVSIPTENLSPKAYRPVEDKSIIYFRPAKDQKLYGDFHYVLPSKEPQKL
jgi:hypothetical protein